MKMPGWWIERRIRRLDEEKAQLAVRIAEYSKHFDVMYYFDESVKAKERIALINMQLEALHKMKASRDDGH